MQLRLRHITYDRDMTTPFLTNKKPLFYVEKKTAVSFMIQIMHNQLS